MTKIEKAVTWAVDIARDSSHGYDQLNRWGPNYDCSSLVISAWEQAGVPVKSAGATYTGNMFNVFCANGFCVVRDGSLKRGDVLLNVRHHTAMYIGNNQIVQASINERGTVTGGQTGDQTGREINISSYYNYPWDYILRYEEDDEAPASGHDSSVPTTIPMVQIGDVNGAVLSLQILLHRKWGITLDEDAEFGPKTDAAVRSFQGWKGLEVDGVVGPLTWAAVIGGQKM